ncbi:MAG: hypothetical protein JW726_01190 [Anaerolineales bacterium]|nr:hypothetical protein [Anaerolineales bacterium]
MNDQLLTQTLHDLADQAIPAEAIPTPALRKHIQTHLQAPKNQLGRKSLQPRRGLAVVAVLLILLAGAIFFLTPPGRAVAQQVIRFFTFAESDVLPLPTNQPTEVPLPTRTSAPTQVATLQEILPPLVIPEVESYPTATPAPSAEPGAPRWNLTIDEAQQLAGFEVRVPASLPPGYRLDNVIFDPQTGEVAQIYGFHPYSAGEQFILHQQPSLLEIVIGESAEVEQMTVGGFEVEYVVGTWFGGIGANAESWHPDSIFHTFRWQEGDIVFTLEILFDDSDTWSPAYWTMDGMLAMLEIVIGIRSEFPVQININYLTSVEQAEEVSGLDLLVPSALPEGFVFTRGVYDPATQQVHLFYQPEAGSRDTNNVRLVIVESLLAAQPVRSWNGYPPDALEAVMVNGNQATFARGAVVDGVYDPGYNRYLVWNTTTLAIEMIYSASPDYPILLEKEQMILIAESMQ